VAKHAVEASNPSPNYTRHFVLKSQLSSCFTSVAHLLKVPLPPTAQETKDFSGGRSLVEEVPRRSFRTQKEQ
jgi:hypothetical protein